MGKFERRRYLRLWNRSPSLHDHPEQIDRFLNGKSVGHRLSDGEEGRTCLSCDTFARLGRMMFVDGVFEIDITAVLICKEKSIGERKVNLNWTDILSGRVRILESRHWHKRRSRSEEWPLVVRVTRERCLIHLVSLWDCDLSRTMNNERWEKPEANGSVLTRNDPVEATLALAVDANDPRLGCRRRLISLA